MGRGGQVEGMAWTRVRKKDRHDSLEVTVGSAQIRELMRVGGVVRNKVA